MIAVGIVAVDSRVTVIALWRFKSAVRREVGIVLASVCPTKQTNFFFKSFNPALFVQAGDTQVNSPISGFEEFVKHK